MQKQTEFSNEYYLATYNCETQNSSLLSEVSLPLYSSRPPNANEENWKTTSVPEYLTAMMKWNF